MDFVFDTRFYEVAVRWERVKKEGNDFQRRGSAANEKWTSRL